MRATLGTGEEARLEYGCRRFRPPRDANVTNERQARDVARNQLSDRDYIGYHQGKDTIWLDVQGAADAAYHLRDECGYSEIQIEATFGDYFEGF